MDKKELAFELEMAMAAQSWCMVRKVIATLKSEDALRESEELRRDADAELWRALLKKVDSDQYQQFCVKFGDVLKAEIAAIDSSRGVDKTERGAG